ncbi:ribonuclease domain-containing protein [Propionivibrio dicarboxylicus]|uniref:Ribonuclease T1 n=1 Tax=Propionivibrio dicarboxylicus TaxID=83767 RepID=A0A1G8IMW9_9RHOO|nr:ribonuclease domain-containing protein [Propionivibrio dicarboxylicus]SDI20296.1 ribonuclease T1 [Propionivibrio dicarboxylicus]
MARLAAHLRIALLFALAGLCGFFAPAHSREAAPGTAVVRAALSELPPEAAQTLERIRRGGPFPYPDKDGSVFGNFEKRLPARARGYYQEFTVPTPGSRDRGARRIIAGTGRTGSAATCDEYYYSHDHYRSFVWIREP